MGRHTPAPIFPGDTLGPGVVTDPLGYFPMTENNREPINLDLGREMNGMRKSMCAKVLVLDRASGPSYNGLSQATVFN